MDDLITWLCAQLDARERAALFVLSDYAHHEASWSVPSTGVIDIGDGSIADETILTGDGPLADFVADNDPAFVLADVEAKRQIIDEHRDDEGWCLRCADPPQYDAAWHKYPCTTLRLLALPFAGRPGWREEWKL